MATQKTFEEKHKRKNNVTSKVTGNKSIFIGTDTATNEKVYLDLKWLQERNVHVVGPPGEGKTRWQMNLFEELCSVPQATIVVLNCKGALGRMCRDFVLGNGLTKRLVWFDPGDRDALIGYNPLKPNGLQIHAHAKAVREGIRSAWGQSTFDATPRLAKYLFIALALARMFEWGLSEALEILRPGARLRREILPRITDPFLRDSLASLDAMSRSLQEERVESCITRLEAFICDPAIASMLTASHSLDLGQVIAQHKIFIINLEIRRPLGLDDVRLLGRMLVNDLASHIFAQPGEDVYFILDECHQFLTSDFCQLLDMGREVGAHVICAHQNLDQLRQEDESRRIYGSVMKCARIKAIFGDCAAEDLDILLRDAMIDQYDNMKVKDERTSLELEPSESTRDVVTSGFGIGGSLGVNAGTSSATARGKSHGNSRQWGASHSHSDGFSFVHSSAMSSGISAGESVLPSGDIIAISNNIEGNTEVDASGTTETDTYGEFQAQGDQDTSSDTKIEGTQAGTSGSVSGSWNRSTSRVPHYEYLKHRVVSSRTFETEQEFLTKCLQKTKAQAVGHFLLKLPKRQALFLRAPFVRDPWVTERQRTANLERVYAQPCYERRASAALTASPAAPSQLPSPAVEFSEAPPSTFLDEEKEEK